MNYQEIKPGLPVMVQLGSYAFRGEIVEKVARSYTKIKVMDTEQPKPRKVGRGWAKRTNNAFGHVVEVHIKQVTIQSL